MIKINSNENNIVMKNNMIIRAKYNISTIENRIFLLLLYKLQKEDGEVILCDIHHDDFKKIIKKKQNQSIEYIEDLLINLRKQSIYFKDKEGWGEYGFINGFKYIEEDNSFRIEASQVIHTYIRDYLKTGYTPVNLAVFFSLINSNSQRFYDLLRLWSGSKNVITYTVDELKELLMLEDKYSKYNDFKRRVIEPAIKELNGTGYFKIDIKENKVGRKVDTIDFKVEDLDKRKYFDKDKYTIENKDEINKNSNIETEDNDFYIPNKKIFTYKTISNFKVDFSDYNFKDKKLESVFEESISATFSKTGENKIKVNSYNYFKKTLENKLESLNNNKIESIKKTKFHNFDETFTKYTEDEFERIIQASQKKKFGQNLICGERYILTKLGKNIKDILEFKDNYFTNNRKLKLEEYDDNGNIIDTIEFSQNDLWDFYVYKNNWSIDFDIARKKDREYFKGDELELAKKMINLIDNNYFGLDKIKNIETIFFNYTKDQINFAINFKDYFYNISNYIFYGDEENFIRSLSFIDILEYIKSNNGFWYTIDDQGKIGMAYLKEPTRKQAKYQRIKNDKRIIFFDFKDCKEFLVSENSLK